MKIITKYKLEILLLALYISLFLTIAFIITSCNNFKKESIVSKAEVNKINKNSVDSEEKSINAKSINAQTYDVLIVNPSQKQLDSIQNTMDMDEYALFVEEGTFYINQAKEYCETIHSQAVEIESGTPVVFESENGIKYPFATHNLLWDIVIFNGRTNPEKIDITNVQDEMKRVYDKAKNKD